ncbi:hypothetical protein [Rhodococcus xishaensis]|uniref:hypothetical protein n=1 Tax=Rhodococcus xishaensis TaxID=2487364 RepID=UPI0013E37F87|nr:hypothetical protein [Rhodococcus xishaensis]
MDTPDERIFLVAGSSVLVTDAIAYAYLRCRPCVVLSDVFPDLPHKREQTR